MRNLKSESRWIAIILIIAIALKVVLLALQAFPFNSDEAIVALMARHILQGERPIFFYGQAYMGSLDAYLVAVFFWIFGQSVWVIRLVQILLYSGTIYTTFLLGKRICRTSEAGLIAAALMAIPTVNVTLYTTVSLGGYGEALLLGNVILLLALSIGRKYIEQFELREQTSQKNKKPLTNRIRDFPFSKYLLFGLLIGLGLWTNGLTLVYSISSLFYLLIKIIESKEIKNRISLLLGMAPTIPGIFIGAFPLWIFLLNNGPKALMSEFLGSAVAVETGSRLTQALNHFISFLALGVTVILGFRPSWAVEWLAIPLIPLILFFWGRIFYFLIRALQRRKEKWEELLLLSGVMIFIIIGFVFTSFGIDPSGRYFLPFSVTLSIIVAWKITSIENAKLRKWKWCFILLLLIYNLSGHIQCAFSASQAFTTQFDSSTIIDHRYDGQLIQFLISHNETRGYGNYWTTYPIDFLSAEKLIYVPELPYHLDFQYTSRDNRYLPYDNILQISDHVAYITAHFPELDNHLRDAFLDEGITWKEEVIGDYRVFYDLSRVVRPDDINLKGASY